MITLRRSLSPLPGSKGKTQRPLPIRRGEINLVKKYALVLGLSAILFFMGTAFAGTTTTVVSVSVTVSEFAEFEVPQEITLNPISSVGQAVTGSVELRLYHNTKVLLFFCIIPGKPITLTSQSGDTLQTEYRPSPELGWIPAEDFNYYTYGDIVPKPTSGVGKTSWDFGVRATADSDRANDAGDYKAYIKVIAAWFPL